MFKKSLFFAFFVLLLTGIRAQEPSNPTPFTEGTIRFNVAHNWAKKMEALSYLSKQKKERVAYMQGNRSEWHEYTLLHVNPTETKYLDSEERAEQDDEGYSWRKETFFTKRNFSNNTLYDALTVQGTTYLINDTMVCQDWKILNDMKEVAGHLCMNASWEDTIKMQKIVAWFALDIPISAGPERLCGLPGLILEADVNHGAMVITADRMDAKKLTTEFDIPKKQKGKKVNETEYRKALKKFIDEQVKAEQPYFWDLRY